MGKKNKKAGQIHISVFQNYLDYLCVYKFPAIHYHLSIFVRKKDFKYGLKFYQLFNKIYVTDDVLGVTSLSYRQFERNFKKQFGITAKKFQINTRLQDTIKKSLLYDERYYLNNALDNGYFDQSHFINEFQKLVGLKPKEYLLKVNSEEHFYFIKMHNKISR